MRNLKQNVGLLALGAFCLMAIPAKAWVIPIVSNYENGSPNWRLLIESEITRWKQEALKYKEMVYTDTLGKKGTGDDGQSGLKKVPGVKTKQSEIIVKARETAGDGANIIANTNPNIGIANLGTYSSAKNDIDKKLLVNAKKGEEYSEEELGEIYEYQRDALNKVATNAIAMGAVETVNAAVVAAESQPKERAKQIAKAKELGALYELMLGMDRRIYERSLHVAAVEATAAGLKAVKVLQGISMGAEGEQE